MNRDESRIALKHTINRFNAKNNSNDEEITRTIIDITTKVKILQSAQKTIVKLKDDAEARMNAAITREDSEFTALYQMEFESHKHKLLELENNVSRMNILKSHLSANMASNALLSTMGNITLLVQSSEKTSDSGVSSMISTFDALMDNSRKRTEKISEAVAKSTGITPQQASESHRQLMAVQSTRVHSFINSVEVPSFSQEDIKEKQVIMSSNSGSSNNNNNSINKK